MRVISYLFDSEHAGSVQKEVRNQLEERQETVTLVDVSAYETREDGVREAMLALRSAVRIGKNPDEIYDDTGNPDFSPGVLVIEAPTGRRELTIGDEALRVLEDNG